MREGEEKIKGESREEEEVREEGREEGRGVLMRERVRERGLDVTAERQVRVKTASWPLSIHV